MKGNHDLILFYFIWKVNHDIIHTSFTTYHKFNFPLIGTIEFGVILIVVELSFEIMHLVENELFEVKKCRNLKSIRKYIKIDFVLFILNCYATK